MFIFTLEPDGPVPLQGHPLSAEFIKGPAVNALIIEALLRKPAVKMNSKESRIFFDAGQNTGQSILAHELKSLCPIHMKIFVPKRLGSLLSHLDQVLSGIFLRIRLRLS